MWNSETSQVSAHEVVIEVANGGVVDEETLEKALASSRARGPMKLVQCVP